MDATEAHTPVLKQRCVDLLRPALSRPGALLIDCTLGMGGHTEAVLDSIPSCSVVGIDRDPQAISMASARLARFGDRFEAVHATYDRVAEVAARFGGADAVLMDLGVSSLQLDVAERGFSYAQDAPLDMRMDATADRTAADILATASAAELTAILRDFGEERFAHKIAAEVVSRRENEPLKSTSELVDVIRTALPQAAMRKGGNPAKRTFQALRIAVNSELDILQRALPAAFECLRPGGRLVIESYQSLEDRMVKRYFSTLTKLDVPADLPFIPAGAQPQATALTRGAEKADNEELTSNPRSASVRLRAVEKTQRSTK